MLVPDRLTVKVTVNVADRFLAQPLLTLPAQLAV
jgi:hypothetical protein